MLDVRDIKRSCDSQDDWVDIGHTRVEWGQLLFVLYRLRRVINNSQCTPTPCQASVRVATVSNKRTIFHVTKRRTFFFVIGPIGVLLQRREYLNANFDSTTGNSVFYRSVHIFTVTLFFFFLRQTKKSFNNRQVQKSLLLRLNSLLRNKF